MISSSFSATVATLTVYAEHVRALSVWSICLVAIGGMLARPFKIPEWLWVAGGAAAIAGTGLLPFPAVITAVRQGTDVYLFLAGMMLLAEIARYEGVFDWVASLAVRVSGGSRRKLFALVYAAGIAVTTVLSNDATAVVLTPAVAAAIRAARAEPLPYLFACALIANAASFVLPISNPANFVVFSSGLPPLVEWIRMFGLASIFSIGVTYGVLRFIFRNDLAGGIAQTAKTEERRLGQAGRVVSGGIAATSVALVLASSFGAPLGAAAIAAATALYLVVAILDRAAAVPILRSVSWSVLALVASLFVLVSAVEQTGLLKMTEAVAAGASILDAPLAVAVVGFATAIGSNLINNLPAGLIVGKTVAGLSDTLRSAAAIGIDLGPNLSVTGSLATILWLLALRREEIEIDAWHFLRVGAIAMPIPLLVAVESLLLRPH